VSLHAQLWRLGTTLLAPALPAYLRRRAARGKEIPERIPERFGGGAIARPPGPLLWLHAASVGETTSILPVLEALAARAPGVAVLLTTGTVTAARLLQQRLAGDLAPEGGGQVLHRFAPLDVPAWGGRFLDSWRPDAAAFVESELWPNLIGAARRRGVPLALVNARMSARSTRRWRWLAPGLARELLGAFALVLAQSEADAARLVALGAPAPRCLGNLKVAAAPLPVDPAALARLRDAVGTRPVLVAASTHPGEESIVAAAHRRLAAEGALPDLLTVLVPRHPERGAALAAELAASAPDLPVARRSLGEPPGPGTALYLADTLGELGLFYRLGGVAFVGGSLVRHGGQNPLEPARLGCPVLLGPHTWNFEEPVGRLLAAGAALRLDLPPGEDASAAAESLAGAVRTVLCDTDRRRAMSDAAAAAAATEAGLPERVAEALLALLPGAGPGESLPLPSVAPSPPLLAAAQGHGMDAGGQS
jgi:3-deoxy-D-manno-octulosonic-acid transferase